ncbi:MAG: chemotaxis protein CheA [Chloroflexi bacterium]|nr:chemotaxis protein CheA [Chloroflexota bacterium]
MENILTFELHAEETEDFLQDVNENLDALEAGILRMEQSADLDTLNATFRAAHTVKAVAATVGHHQMTEITHTLETLFDTMREGELSPTQAVTDRLLATVDVLKALRDEVVTRQPSGVDAAAFLSGLRALINGDAGGQKSAPVVLDIQETQHLDAVHFVLTDEQAAQAQSCRQQGQAIRKVIAVARTDGFAQGARLLQAAMELHEMGQVIAQQPSQSHLNEGQHDGYLWLVLATHVDTDMIDETLGYISDLAAYRVCPYELDELGQSSAELLAELLADTSTDAASAASQSAVETDVSGADQTVRISVERLDTLMNLVGELVTDRTRLVQIQDLLQSKYGKNGSVGALSDMVSHFDRVVDSLQEEVMEARMLPIAHLFQKFPRLVRDVARISNKQVNLIIDGEATELDRSVIEVIGDPLIHLLRNAVDHGLESPQDRIAAGKPPTGTIWLAAAHEEGHIVITVKDDGRGIDPERIRRSAVNRGLMSEEQVAQLDDDAAINYIFQPNLSTAEKVTDVSGRGVGLDVVRTNVKQLSGSVVVESEIGQGTTFRVTLPLTLAIVQAMMIGLGDDVYAIPLTSIVESLYLADVQASTVQGKPVITWRNQVLPIVRLRQFFTHTRMALAPPNGTKQAVVTVAWGKLKAGLVVDQLLGKQEIVIKSLGSFIGNVPGLSGCTILGDGRIALIVDVPGLIGACLQAQRQEGAK